MKYLRCAVCDGSHYKIKYKATFNQEHLDPRIYTSRRIPDKVHFQIVECRRCGLVFSNPIFDQNKIINTYKRSNIQLMEDVENSAKSYSQYLKSLLPKLPSVDRFLDIG